MNLLKRSAYQVQIRHRSTQVKTPLWSKWSPVVVVPAGELMLAQKTTGCITALMVYLMRQRFGLQIHYSAFKDNLYVMIYVIRHKLSRSRYDRKVFSIYMNESQRSTATVTSIKSPPDCFGHDSTCVTTPTQNLHHLHFFY